MDTIEKIIEKFVVTETAKGNHAIMVFDGWELSKLQTFDPDHNDQNPGSNDYYVYKKEGRVCRIEDIEYDIVYHQSWNALMPVVEKIEAIRDKDYGWFKVSIHSNACDIHSKYLMADDKPVYMSDPNAILNTKIESTWYNIVQFILWHNQNKKQ